MAYDAEPVAKGRGEPLGALVQQGAYHERLIAEHHAGLAPHDLTAERVAALASVDATQESAQAAKPEDTAQLNEAKGGLLTLIEELNDVGRNAFEGQAETAAKFNKDILLRGRSTASEEAPEAAQPATKPEPSAKA